MIKIKKLVAEDGEIKFEIYEKRGEKEFTYESYVGSFDEATIKAMKEALNSRADI